MRSYYCSRCVRSHAFHYGMIAVGVWAWLSAEHCGMILIPRQSGPPLDELASADTTVRP